MIDSRQRPAEYSLFAFGNTLLRQRRRIVWWTLAGGVIAGALAFTMSPRYVSTASFVPQGADAGRSGLASLAGQLGVALPASGPGQSPDFYVTLLRSPVLLEPIARDTFLVAEMDGRRIPFSTLFELDASSPEMAQQAGGRLLTRMVAAAVVKMTGIVEVSVTTPWPSVSKAIATRLVRGVDEFNQQTRRGQAAAERQFVEGRLTLATQDLRAAEDRLERFLAANRQFGSPDLTFQRERLQRDVSVRQQVFMSLTQAYEDIRLREVRDTPVISLIQAPSTPTEPKPRHRVTIIVAGLLIGAFAAITFSILAEALAPQRGRGSADAEEFSAALQEMKDAMRRGLRLTKRSVKAS